MASLPWIAAGSLTTMRVPCGAASSTRRLPAFLPPVRARSSSLVRDPRPPDPRLTSVPRSNRRASLRRKRLRPCPRSRPTYAHPAARHRRRSASPRASTRPRCRAPPQRPRDFNEVRVHLRHRPRPDPEHQAFAHRIGPRLPPRHPGLTGLVQVRVGHPFFRLQPRQVQQVSDSPPQPLEVAGHIAQFTFDLLRVPCAHHPTSDR